MQTSVKKGVFITLEGIEGAGKSTHLSYISKILQDNGHKIVETREPGGTRLGEEIRSVLLANSNANAISDNTELLLMFAARSQHIDEIIRPNIESGVTVISDRFTDSSFAYQGGGRGIDPARIRALQNWLHADLNPDLTLLLDLPVETGLERVKKRGESDRFETEQLDFFNKVRSAYLELAAAEPERIAVINVDRQIESIQADIQSTLKDRGIL